MTCCYGNFGTVAALQFTRDRAAKELQRYRRKQVGATTRLLRDALMSEGLGQGKFLDIGAGVGALTFELLEHGAAGAVVVEASPAYLEAVSEEAARRGHTRDIELVRGDFVDVAGSVPAASIDALDRVVCCYPFYERLLSEALRHANRRFAFSYPKERWYVKAVFRLDNLLRRRTAFRTFVHPEAAMRQLIERAGFTLVSRAQTLTWAVDVYRRERCTGN